MSYIQMESESNSEGSDLSSDEDDILGVTMDYTTDTSSASDNENISGTPTIIAGTSRSGRQTTRYKMQ